MIQQSLSTKTKSKSKNTAITTKGARRMSDKYRKVRAYELKDMGFYRKDLDSNRVIIEHVKNHYPSSAHSILVICHSEYNDEYYNNNVSGLIVYDIDGNEIPCKNSIEFIKGIAKINDSLTNCENETPADDYTLFVNPPQLYIKVQ